MELSKSETTAIKGCAILLMLWHHLFLRTMEYGLFTQSLAIVFKVCVALFLFVSGYGMTKQYGSLEKRNFLTAIKFLLRRFINFFLPFWFTVTLIVLFILYIIGIFKAIGRNNQLQFKAKMTVFENDVQVGDIRTVKDKNSTILFGKGGTNATRVEGAEWQFEVRKKNGNPFLVFQKPKFVWRSTQGYCLASRAQSGDIVGGMTVKCGKNRSDTPHTIRIKLLS